MKFGKSLLNAVELCDPEWGPYWVQYKCLKKRLKLMNARSPASIADVNFDENHILSTVNTSRRCISKVPAEIDFFKELKREVKECSNFFDSSERAYRLRYQRILEGYITLKENEYHDRFSWSRLLRSCINLYRDILLLENFAIMNYSGFSKILKKHDKLTGFSTRDAFMKNVMSKQNFTQYVTLLELIKLTEDLYEDIAKMDSVMPLHETERLFIDAVRELNVNAAKYQEHIDIDNKGNDCNNLMALSSDIDAYSINILCNIGVDSDSIHDRNTTNINENNQDNKSAYEDVAVDVQSSIATSDSKSSICSYEKISIPNNSSKSPLKLQNKQGNDSLNIIGAANFLQTQDENNCLHIVSLSLSSSSVLPIVVDTNHDTLTSNIMPILDNKTVTESKHENNAKFHISICDENKSKRCKR